MAVNSPEDSLIWELASRNSGQQFMLMVFASVFLILSGTDVSRPCWHYHSTVFSYVNRAVVR
jgi:hypothetical protein